MHLGSFSAREAAIEDRNERIDLGDATSACKSCRSQYRGLVIDRDEQNDSHLGRTAEAHLLFWPPNQTLAYTAGQLL